MIADKWPNDFSRLFPTIGRQFFTEETFSGYVLEVGLRDIDSQTNIKRFSGQKLVPPSSYLLQVSKQTTGKKT